MSNIEEMDALLRGHGVDPTEIIATEPITEKQVALSRGCDAADAGITKNELPASCTKNPDFMKGYDDRQQRSTSVRSREPLSRTILTPAVKSPTYPTYSTRFKTD